MIGLVCNGLAALINVLIYGATGNVLCLYVAAISCVIALGCALVDGAR